MKKISIYIKDSYFDPSSYYRVIQYFSKLENEYSILYHTQLTKDEYIKYMPISKQSVFIKIYFEILFCWRTLRYLIRDCFECPEVIIVSRRFVNRIMPLIFRLLLSHICKKGCRLYWDFDDHIIATKEVSKDTVLFLSRISSKIIVTHEYLKSLVPKCFQSKVLLLSTTDGEIFQSYIKRKSEIDSWRNKLLLQEIRFIWVGTSSNLEYIEPIAAVLDMIASQFTQKITLRIVCNLNLDFDAKRISIENIQWSREKAIDAVLHSHIGLMPLIDSELAKGKGAFKLIQYLSAGLPVIASSVGFNRNAVNKTFGFCLKDIYNPYAFSKSVQTIFDSFSSFCNSAFEEYQKNFSYAEHLQFWHKLLEETKR